MSGEKVLKNTAALYGGVGERVSAQMTRAQAMRLRTLSEEAYQPAQYAKHLTRAEADRRIEALKAEIELANSF
jgi:hypothetical protein